MAGAGDERKQPKGAAPATAPCGSACAWNQGLNVFARHSLFFMKRINPVVARCHQSQSFRQS